MDYEDPPCYGKVCYEMNLLRSSLLTVGTWEIVFIVYPPVRSVYKCPDYLWKGSKGYVVFLPLLLKVNLDNPNITLRKELFLFGRLEFECRAR